MLACSALLAAAVEQAGGAAADPAALAPLVQSQEQAVQLAARLRSGCLASPGGRLCVPLFATSAVTGASLQLLHAFLHALEPRALDGTADSMQGWRWQRNAEASSPAVPAAAAGEGHGRAAHAPAHFQIDATFEVVDVGTGKPCSLLPAWRLPLAGCLCEPPPPSRMLPARTCRSHKRALAAPSP